MIDGLQDPPRARGPLSNAKLALRAEAIVKRLDPSRIVYHHSSGNLGSMHTSNFYPNFAPIQEMSRLVRALGHQGRQAGVHLRIRRALHLGLDHVPRLVQGQARVRQRGRALGVLPGRVELRSSSATGPSRSARPRRQNLRWEAKQFRAGKLWHRWDYPYSVGSPDLRRRYPVFAMYLADNWRAFRTWGMSANSPWEYGHFWTLARRRGPKPQGAQGGLGQLAAARLQPRLHRRALRTDGPGLRALRLDPHAPRPGR